jgi:hypothetical protein
MPNSFVRAADMEAASMYAPSIVRSAAIPPSAPRRNPPEGLCLATPPADRPARSGNGEVAQPPMPVAGPPQWCHTLMA